jgi:DNA invertase Pin-like site-specific DNA recombinase
MDGKARCLRGLFRVWPHRHKGTNLSIFREAKTALFRAAGGACLLVRIGYARVSTEDQNLALQYDALNQAGCARIFEDQGISAVGKVRPGFQAALDALAPGDVFVIWKMDRAFRSLRHALDILEQFERGGIEFLSLTDQIDTTTPMGKCMYQIRNAFAELERTLISERTKAGMEAARKRGSILGRPRKLTPKQVEAAVRTLDADENLTFTALAKNLNVSARTLGRAVAAFRAQRSQI